MQIYLSQGDFLNIASRLSLLPEKCKKDFKTAAHKTKKDISFFEIASFEF